jgi:hypothetical protein
MHNWVFLIKKNVIFQFTIFCCGKNLQTFLCTYKCFYLLYKDESVCVVVCVCMSGGLPPDLHNLSPQNLEWAPHITRAWHRARRRPQMLTPGGTPYSDPI